MAETTPQLKRDSTMVATAEEGAAFLEKVGQVDEDAKTRAQQKKLDDVPETEKESEAKLERTTTMAATAKEGAELLQGAELGKTRAETAKNDDKETAEEEAKADEDEKPSLTRTTTMAATAKEAAEILEANGGLVEGTRSEAKQVEEAIKASEEEKVDGSEQNGTHDETDETAKLKRKSTMQMTAEEGEEFLKKQKLADPEEVAAKEVEA
eukprot:Seg2369.1 transcript_id=Seg2369.1/GoldUCD/mRNA.D3Y31 product="hypothetical protein" protein_id=Seg2369.1/GoldUCD/D3Y31